MREQRFRGVETDHPRTEVGETAGIAALAACDCRDALAADVAYQGVERRVVQTSAFGVDAFVVVVS